MRLPRLALLAAATLLTACTSTVGGALVSGSAPGSGGPLPPAATDTIAPATFTDCGSVLSAPTSSGRQYSCAKITVPLDYANPSAGTTEVQLLRIHTEGGGKTGSLLVNPGGPGGSGIELAENLDSALAPEIMQNFDLIGWDPRGVGLSDPLECESNADLDVMMADSSDMTTTAGFDKRKQLSQQFDDACKAKYGDKLGFYNTVNTVHDMERIRQAVGDSKMNFLGFSYGTVLGSLYAHYYPDKVRVAVLDGAVGPLQDDLTSWAQQIQGFEDAFDQFSAWCKKDASCSKLGDARTAVNKIFAAAKTTPLKAIGDRPLTWSLANYGVLEALYSQSYWSELAQALADAQLGDGTGLLQLADQYAQRSPSGEYSTLLTANTVINCNDADTRPTDDQVRQLVHDWPAKYPMFGAWSALTLFQCQNWPAKSVNPPLPTASTSAPILVVGNTHDPATPYQGAIDLTKTLGSAELLSWDGQGHTSYLYTRCIDDYVNAYLINGELPPKNTTCPA